MTPYVTSSRNTPFILGRIGLGDYFDAVADGNDISRSKPDPQVFLIAAERLGIPPEKQEQPSDPQREAVLTPSCPRVLTHSAATPESTSISVRCCINDEP